MGKTCGISERSGGGRNKAGLLLERCAGEIFYLISIACSTNPTNVTWLISCEGNSNFSCFFHLKTSGYFEQTVLVTKLLLVNLKCYQLILSFLICLHLCEERTNAYYSSVFTLLQLHHAFTSGEAISISRQHDSKYLNT